MMHYNSLKQCCEVMALFHYAINLLQAHRRPSPNRRRKRKGVKQIQDLPKLRKDLNHSTYSPVTNASHIWDCDGYSGRGNKEGWAMEMSMWCGGGHEEAPLIAPYKRGQCVGDLDLLVGSVWGVQPAKLWHQCNGRVWQEKRTIY